MRATIRLLAGGICGTVLVGLAVIPAAAPASAAARADRTSAVEARRVDRVPTPRLGWFPCYDYAECATVRLPLDYDQPKGATTEIAVLRVKARNQANRIGSLFLNPGGPGGSGTSIALAAPFFLSPELVDRFDLVGVDPRGVASSDNLRCFKSTQEQTEKLAGMSALFPVGRNQERAYVSSARAFGKGCSTTGKPLSGAMSTAEVARDMDVLRRAVGDRKLSYLGFSYGTALGQYYANMFPDRVRAITVDGVINPVSWVGNRRTQNTIQDDRLRSADGAYKALSEIFQRCDAAGAGLCPLAGSAAEDFDTVAQRLKAEPLVFEDEILGQVTFGYADFIGNALGSLYDPAGFEFIVADTVELLDLIDPSASAARKASARKAFVGRLAKARAKAPSRDFPYDNFLETYAGVACTDGLHPKDAGLWPNLTARSDRRAPYFGRAWGWGTVMCARNTWTVRDEDAYRGPFNRRTSAPVLVVGNFWDPATNYDDAVSSARLLPNSRLLSSDSWGHTAYGTSACVTRAVDEYLLRGTLPDRGTVCVGDLQPFAGSPAAQRRAVGARTERPATEIAEVAKEDLPAAGEPKQLPPVVPPAPIVPMA
jgi:pimeloyl-ACP methyl ester carboxylesterase